MSPKEGLISFKERQNSLKQGRISPNKGLISFKESNYDCELIEKDLRVAREPNVQEDWISNHPKIRVLRQRIQAEIIIV